MRSQLDLLIGDKRGLIGGLVFISMIAGVAKRTVPDVPVLAFGAPADCEQLFTHSQFDEEKS